MIQSIMMKAPDEKTGQQFLNGVLGRLPDFSEGAEHADASLLSIADFERCWEDQENLKREPAIKEKYRALTEQGRVVYVEIDW
jgi:hypothetical protein